MADSVAVASAVLIIRLSKQPLTCKAEELHLTVNQYSFAKVLGSCESFC